jgi:hypothetical protein
MRANNPPDDDKLQVVIIEAPTAPTAPMGALTSARIGSTAPTALKEPLPASSSCPQEPVLDNYPTYEPNDSLLLDSGGDGEYIGEGSWGGQIDEDIYCGGIEWTCRRGARSSRQWVG